ncbi:response regulator [Acaryochloris marina]|uniref:Response regulator receiver domain protein (CheY) n=1 Tax=Acaryochloris marina (strain MBIC 11017) TaxID=329726 RepID=B0CA82_ACAM1|nr:response regulator [Acaryochloris marina]ABW26669.1 response regulator receiver domain protein (CheY) [Acaryochloris marina MBIC11017]BDM81457.1 response regulator [Acaryochloris marina MBIC10699]
MTYTSSLPTPTQQDKPQVAPAKVLQKVISEQRSGRITITDSRDPSISWRVYLGGGQMHFAESTMGHAERLPYVLKKQLPDFNLSEPLPNNTSEYSYLCKYWQANNLPLNFFRKLLAILTQEALMQFLALPQGYLEFEPNVGLDPLLLSAPFRQLVLPVRDQINQWAQLQAVIGSPFQKPHLEDPDQFLKLAWKENGQGRHLQNIVNLLEQDLCFYELATQADLDVLTLVTDLAPMVQAGAISLNPYRVIEEQVRPVVACVDDSQTIQQFVKLSLEAEGFEVLQLMDPKQALTVLIEQQPNVILMDIEMPKMDGYELCRMVRQVDMLKEIPVVMLTGREGLIDRMRARMSGCTAYLTKPFNPQELLALVQKLSAEGAAVSQM